MSNFKSGSKHTPGPWKVRSGSVYSTYADGETRIALMDRNEPRIRPIDRDANARLISKAPKMLEVMLLTQWVLLKWVSQEIERKHDLIAAQAVLEQVINEATKP